MPMNALKKEDVIPEEVTQDLVDPVNLRIDREFKVALNQRHDPNQKQYSSNNPPLNLWLIAFSTLGRTRADSGLRTLGTSDVGMSPS
jgi:hypothetical protein